MPETFLGGNIFIYGEYASIIRNIRENEEHILFEGENIELLILSSLIGFHFNHKASKKNEPSEESIELSRIQYPKYDEKMWFISRLLTICSEDGNQQGQIDLAFKEFGTPAARKKMFDMWFAYALGGLEIINERVIVPANRDKQMMATNFFDFIEEMQENNSSKNDGLLDDLLRTS